MNLPHAQGLANEVLTHLASHFNNYTICGSIRRKKETVNDIDIVAIQKTNYGFGEETLSETVRKLDPEGAKIGKDPARYLDGPAIKRFFFKGAMIDLYIAKPEEYEVLILIRTGSKEHNIRLTTLAKGKGWKLKANGAGLVRTNGMEGKDEKILEVIDSTENGILQKLLGRIPTPEQRGI